MIIEGRAHMFGENVSSDAIHPTSLFSTDPEIIKKGAMAGIDPDFHKKVSKGDVIIAGKSFGRGSGREIAPLSLKLAGIDAIVAVSMPRIFLRNCINIGLLPIIADARALFSDGDMVWIDTDRGIIKNRATGDSMRFRPLERDFMEIIEAGGLMNLL